MKIALGIEYDGRAFCGWQSQPQGCAVQDALERALAGIAGHPVTVVGAGRTDAGVHAIGQVAHIETTASRPESAWVRGTNAALPAGIAVLWARPVEGGFHARFSATERRYVYLLLNRPVRPAALAGRVGWFHRPLDLEAMRAAARGLVGSHDFSAFRSSQCQSPTPVRDLRTLDIERQGDMVVFRLCANAFLHRMVRNLVGSLVYVGKGRHSPQWVGTLLAGRDRAAAAPTFAPDGLYFVAVRYDPVWGIDAGEPRDPMNGAIIA